MVVRKLIKMGGTAKMTYDLYQYLRKNNNIPKIEVLEMKKELMKKGLLIGIGLAAYARDHANKFAKELVKKGHINEKEGKRMVKGIYNEADRSRKNISKLVEKEINKLVKAGCKSCKPKKAVKKKAVKKKTMKKKIAKKKVAKRK